MITLTSDFRLKDPYVAEMKGVILTINPKATIVDITHGIEKFNIRMASFVLASAIPYFPKGTVHLAVVDPEVGTKRRAIVIQTKKDFFIGPDNGILILAAHSQGIEHIYQLTNPTLMLAKISSTFHGRDIFAPAAAHLDKGMQPDEFGPEIKAPVQPEFTYIKREGNSLIGEVMHIDSFGNIITNISEKDIIQNNPKHINVELPKAPLNLTLGKTYAHAKPHEAIAFVGSHGFLEIAINQGDIAERFHVKIGDKIAVTAT